MGRVVCDDTFRLIIAKFDVTMRRDEKTSEYCDDGFGDFENGVAFEFRLFVLSLCGFLHFFEDQITNQNRSAIFDGWGENKRYEDRELIHE